MDCVLEAARRAFNSGSLAVENLGDRGDRLLGAAPFGFKGADFI
jgi:hypothetical protein